MNRLLILTCFVLTSCVQRTPWKKVSDDGPWFRPSKKAAVYQRTEKGPYSPVPVRILSFEIDGKKTPTVPVGYEIDCLAETSEVVAQWPDTKGYTGRFLGRLPPLALHLVAIDPIVLVGAGESHGDSEDFSSAIFTNTFSLIPVSTKIAQQGEAIFVVFNSNGKLVKHDIKASELPKTISIGPGDQIVLSIIGKCIVITRKSQRSP